MFKVKNLEVLNLDPKLQEIAEWAKDNWGLDIITSGYRPGDTGVHGQQPVRGLDLRCRDRQVGEMVEALINSKWKYDPNRPNMNCCLFHDIGQGIHLHLQVHPNTVKM